MGVIAISLFTKLLPRWGLQPFADNGAAFDDGNSKLEWEHDFSPTLCGPRANTLKCTVTAVRPSCIDFDQLVRTGHLCCFHEIGLFEHQPGGSRLIRDEAIKPARGLLLHFVHWLRS
jgi:hypothetical protein